MTESISFDFADLRPRSWADAFPWLAGAAGTGTGTGWWDAPIDNDDPVVRRSSLAKVSELAMERLTRWTIGQIFPGLSSDFDLLQLHLPARAINALGRHGCGRSGDLMQIELDQMLDWRGVGAGTVDEILQALADVSTSLATPTVTSSPSGPRKTHDVGASSDKARLPEWTSALVDDLMLIANWYRTVGLPGQTLLGGELPPGTPSEIAKARQRIEALSTGSILSDQQLQFDVAGLFEKALSLLDPRAAQILGQRLFADEPMTLDELGQTHNVTRERIRQIEAKARGAMLSFVSEEGPLAAVAAAARGLIGTIRPLDDLLGLIPALGREVMSVGQPAWRVLDRLDDAYEIEDGWCVVPTVREAEIVTQTLLQEGADQYGVVRLDELDLIETSQRERKADLTASWLARCGYIIEGEFGLVRTSSVGDYAAAILSIEGSPLSVQEVVDRFVFERSTSSTRNALASDGRFERVDRDQWALKEWGMEAYSGIRSVIRQVVARDGGRARLDDVIEYITARYNVSGRSVIAYAGAAPFITKNGVVQLASAGRGPRKVPERTSRLFRRNGGWAYRVRISTDHLRGSGSVAPLAVASILNLQAGETKQLDSPLGPQAVAWTGIQPSFGTIRRFLLDQNIAAGTEAFLVIYDDATFNFEPARALVGDPLIDALSLIGAAPTADREAARLALVRAIVLVDSSPVSSMIGAYRDRGDTDVADLLLSEREYWETEHVPASPIHGTSVDQILDLL